MKEAKWYKKLKDNKVQCELCPRKCIIPDKSRGNCRTRLNKEGKLYSIVYGKPCTTAIDPIEKKPIYHFLPGHASYSIATAGCNLHCSYCQNWAISQANPEDVPSLDLPPKSVIGDAILNGCKSIAYTYTDPAITAIEYVIDTAKLARAKGLKNVIVSNGFINENPLRELCKYLDAVNIDLKGFDDKFYREHTTAWLEPVLRTLKILKELNVWFEITNLIIPTLNDDMKKIKEMCEWIKDNLGTDHPLFFTAFFPSYKMLDIPPTTAETLDKAYAVAKKAGLKYVYTGNIFGEKGNTYCPKCKELLISRSGFGVLKNNLKKGRCPRCNLQIPGVWE